MSKYAYIPIKQNINEGGDERGGAVGGIFQDVLDRMIFPQSLRRDDMRAGDCGRPRATVGPSAPGDERYGWRSFPSHAHARTPARTTHTAQKTDYDTPTLVTDTREQHKA